MIRRPPRSTRTDTLCPYTTLFRSTMLVHEPGRPGERIKEDRPIAPGWAYPKSKAAAENAISESRGDIPVVFLHLAGLYDERTSVPTFANQIARIYERDFQRDRKSTRLNSSH